MFRDCELFIFEFLCSTKSAVGNISKLASSLKDFKVNTSPVPEDQLTHKIRKLREIKGGFNFNEAILFKIGEDLSKGDLTQLDGEKLDHYFKLGQGKADLDNAVIWIYRDLFSSSEIRKLTKFYRSSAGQKLSEKFPIIMLESLKSAEEIMKNLKKSE